MLSDSLRESAAHVSSQAEVLPGELVFELKIYRGEELCCDDVAGKVVEPPGGLRGKGVNLVNETIVALTSISAASIAVLLSSKHQCSSWLEGGSLLGRRLQ